MSSKLSWNAIGFVPNRLVQLLHCDQHGYGQVLRTGWSKIALVVAQS